MKILISLLVAASILLPAQAAFSSAKTPKAPASFEGSPAFSKLDLRSREAWRSQLASKDPGKKLECFIKSIRPMTKDDKALLATAGFKARTFVGTIATGEVTAEGLQSVAELDFVSAVELAVPLSTKKPD
ncbi:MAG TPA: hypothetical protein PLY45_02000 [bacterium]|nr:hypothetical protein [bacterium]